MQKQPKLRLHRDTVRRLDTDHLAGIQGGYARKREAGDTIAQSVCETSCEDFCYSQQCTEYEPTC